ncbi:MAG TPA: hypothetical protein VLF21_01425 [Candidatus Saccharimonadales bacterium]|nr:hypothetical protein [Candidatus Saccharimonadales bacterium]
MSRKLGPSHRGFLEYLLDNGGEVKDPEGKLRDTIASDLVMTIDSLSVVIGRCKANSHIDMDAARSRGTTRITLTEIGRSALTSGTNGSSAVVVKPKLGATDTDISEEEANLDLEAEDGDEESEDEEAEDDPGPTKNRNSRAEQDKARSKKQLIEQIDSNVRLHTQIRELKAKLAEVPEDIQEALAIAATAERRYQELEAKCEIEKAQLQQRLDKTIERIHELEQENHANSEGRIALRIKVHQQRQELEKLNQALTAAEGQG